MKKVKQLLKNKTFYLMLSLAIAVIAVSGFVSRMRDFNTEMQEYAGGYDIDFSEEFKLPEEEPVQYNPVEEKVVVEEPQPVEEEQKTVPVAVKQVVIALPLQGELLTEHSEGELVYSKTMEDWRTHNGIDIAAEAGTAVKAAADGVVTEVGFDGLNGFCVTIDHDGFLTKYCGMQQSDIISKDTKVKAGDIIGGVGLTCETEVAEPPHLHFELIKEEKSVNPLLYIGNNVL